MSPTILLGLVIVVLALGGVVHWTDRTAPNTLIDRDRTIARFAQDYPEAQVTDMWCAQDGKVALLLLEDPAQLGLVVANGDFEVTRTINGTWLRKLQAHAKGLRLTTSDFSMPWIDILLTEDAQRQWADRLAMLQQEGAHGRP